MIDAYGRVKPDLFTPTVKDRSLWRKDIEAKLTDVSLCPTITY